MADAHKGLHLHYRRQDSTGTEALKRMVNVGIIGIGFMGMTHYKAMEKVRGGKVTAICTRNPEKLAGDWRGIRGNFGGDGGVQDLSRVARYAELDDLINDKRIDLVDICLPTYMHRNVTIRALAAGKHVLVEKPIALTLKDADAMLAAAERNKRIFMVGQVVRFSPPFAHARNVVLSGKHGDLLGAHFRRVISMPAWGDEGHFTDPARSGGPSIDLHIHDVDFILYLTGTPERVHVSAIRGKNGMIVYQQSQYFYEKATACISCQSGAIAMSGLRFEHGYDIYLQRATLQYNNLFTGDRVWTYTEDGARKEVLPTGKDAFLTEMQHAVNCLGMGMQSDIISGAQGREALRVCLKEQNAALSGRTVRV